MNIGHQTKRAISVREEEDSGPEDQPEALDPNDSNLFGNRIKRGTMPPLAKHR
jgi:hypothetical protein